MHSQNIISNERGLTLLEIVIASSILIVIGLGIATLMVQMNQNSVNIQGKAELFNLQQQLTYDLQHKPISP